MLFWNYWLGHGNTIFYFIKTKQFCYYLNLFSWKYLLSYLCWLSTSGFKCQCPNSFSLARPTREIVHQYVVYRPLSSDTMEQYHLTLWEITPPQYQVLFCHSIRYYFPTVSGVIFPQYQVLFSHSIRCYFPTVSGVIFPQYQVLLSHSIRYYFPIVSGVTIPQYQVLFSHSIRCYFSTVSGVWHCEDITWDYEEILSNTVGK
jgi:hypothetical protein